MTAIKNRSSALAIMEESTEGTIVPPAAATDYIALQEGFELAPNFESLENAEIRASIGKSKPITGLETPSATFSHYLRHSGVEGQAPNYKKLLKAVFGEENVQATERTTAAGSTVSQVNLAAGGGDYARGRAILLKDGTNGYSIRPVDSVAGNNLTLGFNLAAAPAAGITCGKFVNYTPANDGHPTLSAWLYRGQGGLIEALAGGRITDFSVDVAAGQLINASYTMEGVKYFFDPITILSTDRYIDFTDDDGTFAASITAKTYRDPHELAAALQDAMNTANPGETKTVTYSDTTGKFTIASTGAVFSILWNTGANTANTIGDKIGFSVAADDTGALTYTSDNAQDYASPQTPSYDAQDPAVAKANECLLGDASNLNFFCASNFTFTIANTKQNIECVGAESGVKSSLINGREVTITVSALIEQYDADKFKKFRAGDNTKFMFNFGSKVGGNWVAGACGSIYIPTAVINEFSVGDNNGLAILEATLSAYVDANGNGEVYLNFL